MPVLGGHDAARRLRADGYPAPIIALTASTMAGDRRRCLESGCVGYVPKPLDRAALFQEIQATLVRE